MLCPECGTVVGPGPMRVQCDQETSSAAPVVKFDAPTALHGHAHVSGIRMTGDSDERQTKAVGSFKRLLLWCAGAGVLMTIGSLAFLQAVAVDYEMNMPIVITVIGGVFVSVVLGGGLMAMGFYSSNSGHDDDNAGAKISSPAGRDVEDSR